MADQLAIPQGATIGDTPSPGQATGAPQPIPQGASIASTPAGAAPEQLGVGARIWEGVKESVAGAVALPKMFLAPPKDATEHMISLSGERSAALGGGSAAALGAYRLAKHVVDS